MTHDLTPAIPAGLLCLARLIRQLFVRMYSFNSKLGLFAPMSPQYHIYVYVNIQYISRTLPVSYAVKCVSLKSFLSFCDTALLKTYSVSLLSTGSLR